jgi:hypothetical protein
MELCYFVLYKYLNKHCQYKLITMEEKRLFRQRIYSLKDKLEFTESFPTVYLGGSPAFIRYSRANLGSYPIPQYESRGSIASLAKRELERQFADEDISQWQRYCIGRALGLNRQEIYAEHKKNGEGEEIKTSKKPALPFDEIARIGKEVLEFRKACEDFEELFSGEKAYIHYSVRLELNLRRDAYEVSVYTLSGRDFILRDFILRDPLTPEKMKSLHDYISEIAGPISRKVLLGEL